MYVLWKAEYKQGRARILNLFYTYRIHDWYAFEIFF